VTRIGLGLYIALASLSLVAVALIISRKHEILGSDDLSCEHPFTQNVDQPKGNIDTCASITLNNAFASQSDDIPKEIDFGVGRITPDSVESISFKSNIAHESALDVSVLHPTEETTLLDELSDRAFSIYNALSLILIDRISALSVCISYFGFEKNHSHNTNKVTSRDEDMEFAWKRSNEPSHVA